MLRASLRYCSIGPYTYVEAAQIHAICHRLINMGVTAYKNIDLIRPSRRTYNVTAEQANPSHPTHPRPYSVSSATESLWHKLSYLALSAPTTSKSASKLKSWSSSPLKYKHQPFYLILNAAWS